MKRRSFLLLLGTSCAFAFHSHAADVRVDYNVMVPMRDGVHLSTDIHRPAAEGKYPVILVRDPYENGAEAAWVEAGRDWVARGYVFAHQNVRGRLDSEGTFHVYTAEADDGFDAQQWLSAQTWSNGKVGMLGMSYSASVQWLSAPRRAPALTAMAPMMTPFNYYSDVAYVGGALSLSSRIGWARLVSGRTNQNPDVDWTRQLRHLPLATMDRALGYDLPHWRDWIDHPTYDEYWQRVDVEAQIDQIDVPAYNIAGWYDVFLRGSLGSYIGMVKGARTGRARRSQKLLIGPWPHTDRFKTTLGALNFGPEAIVDLDALQARWFDHWLKGEDTGLLDEPPVRLFVMGENQWRSEQEWPLARTRYTRFFLHGGGVLAAKQPKGDQPADVYFYDPENPVPTLGGNLMFKPTPAGPFDQSALEARRDVLVYTSAPLQSDLEVTGPVTVTLYAASSARDTDFTAKLVDVHPDGKAYNLVDGIIRARYRKSLAQPELIRPGEVYEYTIDLWATSNLFKKGHRIRVDISSSNFPRFDRNPNTGNPFGQDALMQTARQTIHHSRRYPSHITLPVIPR